MKAVANGNKTYAIVRHHDEQHPLATPMFTYQYVATHQTSLERQIKESLLIESYPCDNVLNGKGEWGANLVPRASFSEATAGNIAHTRRLNRIGNMSNNTQNLNHNTDKSSVQNEKENEFNMQFRQRKRKRREIELATASAVDVVTPEQQEEERTTPGNRIPGLGNSLPRQGKVTQRRIIQRSSYRKPVCADKNGQQKLMFINGKLSLTLNHRNYEVKTSETCAKLNLPRPEGQP